MHLEISPAVVVLGLMVGATYGILAVGLVLIYRINKIINFAHGEIGGFGASFMAVAVNQWGIPYWLFFPVAIGIGAGMGGIVEIGVVRRLRSAPRLMSVIATLGFAQFLAFLSLAINNQSRTGSLFPEPPGLPSFHVQTLLVTPGYTGMLFLTPLVAIALALFLRFTRLGVAMRAAAANPDAARLDGVFAARMSALAWVIAGGISAFTAILILPTTAFAGSTFGPSLLVRALAAAVLARMSNFVVAFAAGLGLGVVEQVILFSNRSGGQMEAALFVIILAALLLIPQRGSRVEDKGSAWAGVTRWRPLPVEYRKVFLIRHGTKIIAILALALAAVVPLFAGAGGTFNMTIVLALAMVGLSLGIITGLAGQLSLGQFAFAGIGAAVAIHVADASNNYLLAILAGGAAGALASVIVGVPALRIRGLMLAVTTLSLALMTESWLLQQPWMLGGGTNPGHPMVGIWILDTARSYYLLVLGFLVLSIWLANHVRQGGIGRILVAIRDNEDAARAFTISSTGRKLQAFAVSGLLAGIGGGVLAFGFSRISFDNFHTQTSVDVVAMAVIGGIGLLAGPLLGALYIVGIPTFLPLDSAGLAAQAFGWLLLILYVPGGLAALLRPLRDRVADTLAGWSGVAAAEAPAMPELATPAALPTLAVRHNTSSNGVAPRVAGPLLEATGLTKRYGGVAAVDSISMRVEEGETLGLIGPNGAGKTTLFELLSGFNRPDSGTIKYAGHQLDRAMPILGRYNWRRSMSPERRGRLGLIRSFQDAALFPTLLVEEVVMLSLERSSPTTLVASAVGSLELEVPKRKRAGELIEMMGLEQHRNKPILELSTGTRRIVELTCMIALSPRLLLLDEPSSGIAQRETEALGELLLQVKNHLGATLIIIEHDIPMIMGLADRIIAMESGRIIAEGSPAEIRSNELVIDAYLGRDHAAIQRSGTTARRHRATAVR